jgi:hypothetical protein
MQTVTKKDDFRLWIEKTNIVSEEQGELDNLHTAAKSSVVDSLNEKYNIINNIKLSTVEEDPSPELGEDLVLNTYDIIGVGNIDITGSYSGTLTSTVTGVTHPLGDNSIKIATTAYVTNSVGAVTIAVGGDLSGTVGNAQIVADSVGISELDVSDGNNGDILSTDGNGSLSFIAADLTLGGDLTGTLSTAQIASNTIGVNELNVSEGTDGQVLRTNGAGALSFMSVMTETTITPTVGQTVFPITYIVGRLAVFLNGIKLVNVTDFTATNGTDVTLLGGIPLVTLDRVEFHVFC